MMPAVTAAAVVAARRDLDAGQVVTLTLTFGEAVKVAGTPALLLNDGGTASYLSGSGSNVLTFRYTVAAGQNTAALAVTGTSLPTGTSIADGAGNAASLSGAIGALAGAPQIDTVTPTVTAVAVGANYGDLGVGQSVTLTLTFSEAVNVAGTPALLLNDGGTARYVSGSGNNALTFLYTVAAGQNTTALAVTGTSMPAGASIADGAGNAASLGGAIGTLAGAPQIDTTPFYSPASFWNTPIPAGATVDQASSAMLATSILPYVKYANFANGADWGISVVYASSNDETYTLEDPIYYNNGSISFKMPAGAQPTTGSDHHLVVINGSQELDLWDAQYNAATDTWWAGSYFVVDDNGWGAAAQPGQHAGSAEASGFSELGGLVTPEEIAQGYIDHALSMTIPVVLANEIAGSATGTDGTSTNPNAIPEGAHIQLNPSFNVDAQSWPTWEKIIAKALQTYGAYVSDTGGSIAFYGEADNNAGDLQWSAVGVPEDASLANLPWGQMQVLQVTTSPTVTAEAITPVNGNLQAGQVVTVTLTLSKTVFVTGTPTLSLNNGGVASYSAGSGTNTLTFQYTVAAGQSTAALAVIGVNLTGPPGTTSVTDSAGNAADLLVAAVPIVTSVVASPASADLDAGKVVTLTVNMSGLAVVVGTPLLNLNDGGTATYVSGSSTGALTFSYTVLAGQNTAALAITGITFPACASITDGDGNAANLAGVTAGFPQTVMIDSTLPAVTERLAVDTGWSAKDLITSNPNLTGTGDANAVVTLTENGHVVGTTTASAAGAWTYTPPGLANGSQTIVASETDAAGNTGTASLTFTLDTTSPVVTAITAAPANADLGTGQVITFTVSLSAAVGVTGTPMLTLNDGASAKYSAGSGTSTLTFKYTVAAGQNTSDLAVTGSSLPAGATITNIAGNAANLSGAIGSLPGRLIVDTADKRTTISSGAGQIVNAGTGNDVVVLSAGSATLGFSGSNDIAFLGGGSGAVNATINDAANGLTVYVLNGGTDVFNGFTHDPTAVVDLLGGIGGYSSVPGVLAALTADGSGGTKLALGSGGSIDFVGVAPTALHAANFLIG